ncbi:hypothetical protein K493DRAFT_316335 [Basidiobolus meristosporus CBS 931.73]|uniref:TFIIS-type domain-containing protein n=1 Tax=Basidiobolus meristosporus CBS 931.73 TaxID=1314790 RepID=A0A1Y1Y5G3_9FUNG|nr:hypothetical protein K493DRAFT_316335 [Basidiobolus meristosporus CBS 931.73]|eukprot:ORX92854.1 hypothetical protein K493DRAFT_316335 [Basidiobolus meristosporus CBS 931.73]
MDPPPTESSILEDAYTQLYIQTLIDDDNTSVLVKHNIISADEQNQDLPYLLNSVKKYLSAKVPKSTSTNSNTLCKYCGANNVLVLESQLRSADEGSNLVHECPDCHKSWTI